MKTNENTKRTHAELIQSMSSYIRDLDQFLADAYWNEDEYELERLRTKLKFAKEAYERGDEYYVPW